MNQVLKLKHILLFVCKPDHINAQEKLYLHTKSLENHSGKIFHSCA